MVQHADIRVERLTRVEGHGDIRIVIENGALKEARFPIVESPRLFEVFMRGKSYDEVVFLAARICGICAASHSSAALKGIERAFGISLPEKAVLFRKLGMYGEIFSSHMLHVYFLAGPDYLGESSLFPFWQKDRETLLRAVKLKALGYEMVEAVTGRHPHPVGMKAGGFSFVPSFKTLSDLKSRIDYALRELEKTVELFSDFPVYDYDRKTEYVSLKNEEEYPFYEGELYSDVSGEISVDRYRDFITEYNADGSSAKYARFSEGEYMVGAMARLNNNFGQLSSGAKAVAEQFGLPVPCNNPFKIVQAQLVESVHCLEKSRELLEEISRESVKPEEITTDIQPKKGVGVGCVEAPRGVLIHEYDFDEKGILQSANQIIPTAQNLGNIEADMRAYIPRIIDREKEEIEKRIKMLIRAYDPCISCSTHVIQV